jgi:hypothetical protein
MVSLAYKVQNIMVIYKYLVYEAHRLSTSGKSVIVYGEKKQIEHTLVIIKVI